MNMASLITELIPHLDGVERAELLAHWRAAERLASGGSHETQDLTARIRALRIQALRCLLPALVRNFEGKDTVEFLKAGVIISGDPDFELHAKGVRHRIDAEATSDSQVDIAIVELRGALASVGAS